MRPPLVVRRGAFSLVLLLTLLSVLVTVLVGFRPGGYLLALALLVGATARGLLPDYLCLGLLNRSRRLDTVTMLLLGVAVAVVVRSVPA